MLVITFPTIKTTIMDILGYTQDRLMGLNVRLDNYVERIEEKRHPKAGDEQFDMVCIPFAVMCHCDGMYTDENGVEYQEDYPSDFESTFHYTRKGAECAVAWHDLQCPKQRCWIAENHWVERWQLNHHEVQD